MVWPPELRAQLTALIAGVSCGFGAYFLGLPLPWMLGPMLGNTVLAVAGVPVVGPDKWRSFVIPVIGVMLGSAITVEIFSQLGGWILTLALLPVYLLMAAGVSFLVYRRIGGCDANGFATLSLGRKWRRSRLCKYGLADALELPVAKAIISFSLFSHAQGERPAAQLR